MDDISETFQVRVDLTTSEDIAYDLFDRIDSILSNVGGFEQLLEYGLSYSERSSNPTLNTRYNISSMSNVQQQYYSAMDIIVSSPMMIPTYSTYIPEECVHQLREQLIIHFGRHLLETLTESILTAGIDFVLDDWLGEFVDGAMDFINLLQIVYDYDICIRTYGGIFH